MFTLLSAFKNRYLTQRGQGMVEYAVILAFVAAVAVYFTGTGALGDAIHNVINNVTNKL